MKQRIAMPVPGATRLVAAVMFVFATSSSGCAPQPSPSEPIPPTARRGAQGAALAQGESPASSTNRLGSTQPAMATDGTAADRDASDGQASSAGSGSRFAPGCPGAERHELTKRKVERIAKGVTCASLSISRFPDSDALDVRSESWEIYPETRWGEQAPFAHCRFDQRMLQRVEKAVSAELDDTDRACMLGNSVPIVGGDREQVRQLNDRVRSRCQSAAMLTWLVVDFDARGKAQAVRLAPGVEGDINSPERDCLWQALRGQAYACLADSSLSQGYAVE